ncbi:MAG: signal peptidase II [Alphaproteobacteria bacterium]|nr:signal peptidase II [Alphaproteobacteria bacterium]
MRIGRHVNIATYLIALVLVCDQMTKWWILNEVMRPPQIVPINSFFNLVLVWNKGVTFGLLNQYAPDIMPWILTGTAILITGLLTRWLLRTSSTTVALGLGAVIGGAVGNIIDRLRHGAVVDFLDFHFRTYHWPAFNVADSAIVIGVSLLLLDSLVRGR